MKNDNECRRGAASTPERSQEVATALVALGSAWRHDWSEIDGRQLRHSLETLAGALTGDGFDLAQWHVLEGICPTCRLWTEHCDCEEEQR